MKTMTPDQQLKQAQNDYILAKQRGDWEEERAAMSRCELIAARVGIEEKSFSAMKTEVRHYSAAFNAWPGVAYESRQGATLTAYCQVVFDNMGFVSIYYWTEKMEEMGKGSEYLFNVPVSKARRIYKKFIDNGCLPVDTESLEAQMEWECERSNGEL